MWKNKLNCNSQRGYPKSILLRKLLFCRFWHNILYSFHCVLATDYYCFWGIDEYVISKWNTSLSSRSHLLSFMLRAIHKLHHPIKENDKNGDLEWFSNCNLVDKWRVGSKWCCKFVVTSFVDEAWGNDMLSAKYL